MLEILESSVILKNWMRIAKELPWLAGEADYIVRREERQGKNHGEQPTLRRWTEGVEGVLATIQAITERLSKKRAVF